MTPEKQQDGIERSIGRIEGMLEGFNGRFDTIENKLNKINGCVNADAQRIASLEEYRKNSRNKTILTGGVSGGVLVGIFEFLKYLIQGHK